MAKRSFGTFIPGKQVMAVLFIVFAFNKLVMAESIATLKQIALEKGCYAAIGSESVSLIVCIKDDVLDKGLSTETHGCSARIINVQNKKFVHQNRRDELPDQFPLAPVACKDGGLDLVLKWPVDEFKSFEDYVTLAFKEQSDVQQLNVDSKPRVEQLLKALRMPSPRSSRDLIPEESHGKRPEHESVNEVGNLGSTQIEVFFGTDRRDTGNTDPSRAFSDLRANNGRVTYGKTLVSIPYRHQYGVIDLPSMFSINTTPNPNDHMIVKSISRLESAAFIQQLSERIAANDKKETLVFIHGFNMAFTDAALRTAQMAYDLNFRGAPVFYSWPAESLLRYAIAAKNVEWSLPQLTQFLRDISQKTGAQKIHLVAHSMGNRGLIQALNSLAAEAPAGSPPRFQNIVLAAPDFSQIAFRRIADAVKSTTHSLTLYASDYDRALQISARMHREPRLGQAGSGTLVLPFMDTIDASAVDTSFVGHSYYGDNPTVIMDLTKVINESVPVALRPALTRQQNLGGELYWQLMAPPAPININRLQ